MERIDVLNGYPTLREMQPGRRRGIRAELRAGKSRQKAGSLKKNYGSITVKKTPRQLLSPSCPKRGLSRAPGRHEGYLSGEFIKPA